MRLLKCILFVSILFACKESNAQKQFSAVLQFPSHVNTRQISLFYDDGKNDNIDLKADFINHKATISKPFHSKYATIMIAYQGKSARFWIGTSPANITFSATDSASHPLQHFKLTNAFAIEEMAGAKEIKEYTVSETKALENFKEGNKQWFRQDSLIALYEEKSRDLSAKRIDFVKNNGDSYYSFWLFRRELVYADYNIDSLIKIYKNSFPDSLKNSFEGTEILKRLTGRNIKKNVKAVDFIATDVTGKTVSLQDYREKHLLLTFWASWCVPCVEEIPAIKTIRNQYPTDKLEIIFVTLDADSVKFSNAVKKYELNWTHIFNDIEILKKYGVLGIPQVYLIDASGTVVYSRAEENDQKLDSLSRLLSERIKIQ